MPPATPNARDAAYRRLAVDAERFPEFGHAPLETPGLDPRDAALARAIHRVSIRRWLTLRHILSAYLKQDFEALEPAMRGVLMGGAAQVLFLDRVPDHAALDESVRWAKATIRPGAGAMVNAVLRRVAGSVAGREDRWEDAPDLVPRSDGGAIRLRGVRLPEPRSDRWSVAFSLPAELLRKWAHDTSEETALLRARHTITEAPIVLSTGDTEPASPEAAPHDAEGHRVYSGDVARLGAWLERNPGVWAQDAGSSASLEPIRSLDLDGALVVDWCAGKGTKTRQLARIAPSARIVACDPDEARAEELRAATRPIPSVEVLTPAEAQRACDGRGGLVLLDVPCSNTGVLPRRPEAAYRALGPAWDRLEKTQEQILREAMRLLAPDGKILYSTCSLEPEENERRTAWARETLGLREVWSRADEPAGMPGDDDARYRDGSYSCLLVRASSR